MLLVTSVGNIEYHQYFEYSKNTKCIKIYT